jgi:hypothetical protein
MLLRYVLLFAIALSLSACGELDHPSGSYQGKADIQPWDSPEAGGAKAQWENRIETRTQNQNEYTRTR